MGWARIFGGKIVVLISTSLADDGDWSQFLGGAFVQCDDIPLMMAGSKNQPGKWKLKHGLILCFIQIF